MMTEVNFSGKKHQFRYNESSQCWFSKIDIKGTEIEFEIDKGFCLQDEIDWEHFEKFLNFISSENRLSELVESGPKPIHEIGLAYFRTCLSEVNNWKAQFSNSIIFRGHPEGINYKSFFEFSLVYDFAGEKKVGVYTEGDAYGLYLVDVTNLQINGARRIQC